MSAGTAIVTLAIGERHGRLWKQLCEANWSRYARRHGYDVICVDEPLDHSERARRRSPAWQKCLILDHPDVAGYERVVWVDADVLISPRAPAIAAQVPVEKVGAVDEYASPNREAHADTLAKLYRHWEATGTGFIRNETARDYYAVWGLAAEFDAVVQTGVMVLSPAHHRQLLVDTYRTYEDRGPGWNYEMRPLSYELLRAGCVTWLDPRFNRLWSAHKASEYPFLLNNPDHPRAGEAATAALHDVYFLHFTGSLDDMARVDDRPRLPVRLPRPRPPAPDRPTPCTAPVALFLYGRSDTAREVLASIRAVRPERLLVIGDAAPGDGAGPSPEEVAAARAVIDEVDWECEVTVDFAESHLGQRQRIQSGLDWVFEQVPEAVVLEDDCVPDASFFAFCQQLLAHHRNDPRVMAISGDNFSSDPAARPDRYRYSRYPLIWGWATWRRAWGCHDPEMRDWPRVRDSGWLEDVLGDRHAAAYWAYLFEQTYNGAASWDYAWVLSCWRHGGLCILPEVNLVSNIGFRADATNTRTTHSAFANLPRQAARFPLRHPERVAADVDGDRFLEDILFSGNVARMFERLRRARRARLEASR